MALLILDAQVVQASVPLEWQLGGSVTSRAYGHADLVWRHSNSGAVKFWLQDGFTILDAQVVQASVPLEWQLGGVGDVNGYGRADLVWRHSNSGAVKFWLQDGFTILDAQVVQASVPLEWQLARGRRRQRRWARRPGVAPQ